MPRYNYGHLYAIVTKKGRIVQLGDWRETKHSVQWMTNNWNKSHQSQRHTVKIKMRWPIPKR